MKKLLETLKKLTRQGNAPTRSLTRSALSARYQRRRAYRHHPDQAGVDPTRFGDWEYNGRCTDFI